MGFVICPCGKEIKNWKKGIYQIIKKNTNGKIIFAVCYHGKIIIDRRKK